MAYRCPPAAPRVPGKAPAPTPTLPRLRLPWLAGCPWLPSARSARATANTYAAAARRAQKVLLPITAVLNAAAKLDGNIVGGLNKLADCRRVYPGPPACRHHARAQGNAKNRCNRQFED